MSRKRKILKNLESNGLLTDKKTVKNYEQKIKEQEQEIKDTKDKLSAEIKKRFGSVENFIYSLQTL